MTAHAYLVLRCDEPDCGAEEGAPINVRNTRALRHHLAGNGWGYQRRDGRMADLCPDHSDTGPTENAGLSLEAQIELAKDELWDARTRFERLCIQLRERNRGTRAERSGR